MENKIKSAAETHERAAMVSGLLNTDFRKVFKYYNYTLFFTIFNLGKS